MPTLLCYVVVLFGQAADNKVPAPNPVVLQLGPDHCVYRRPAPDVRRKRSSPVLELLTDPLITQELDVTPPQQQELVKLKLRYNKLEQFAIDSAVGKLLGEDRGSKGAIERNIDEVVQGIEKDLADILVPHQVIRLQQISFRYSVLSKGIAAALQGSLGVQLNIDEAGQRVIRDQWQRLASECSEMGQRESKAVVVHCLNVLDERQRKLLAELVGDVNRYGTPSVEILAKQLSSEAIDSAIENDLLTEYVFYSAGWVVNASGRLQRDGALTIGDGYLFLGWMLIKSPVDKQYYGNIPLIDVAWELATNEANAESQAEVRRLADSIDALRMQVAAGELTVDAYLKRVTRLHLQLTTDMIRRVVAKIPEEQANLTEMVLLRRLIALRGLPACLTDGALARRLATTDEQKEILNRHRGEGRERMEQLNRQLEDRWWQALAAGCDARQQATLKQLVGDPPRALLGMPELAFYPTWELGRPIPNSTVNRDPMPAIGNEP